MGGVGTVALLAVVGTCACACISRSLPLVSASFFALACFTHRLGIAMLQAEEKELMPLTFEHLVSRIKTMPNNIRAGDPDIESKIDELLRAAMNVQVSAVLKDAAIEYHSKIKTR